MRIYIDGSKRAAVSRMFSVWKKMGHMVVDDHRKADIQLSVVKIKVEKGLPTVLRLDGIYYDKADNYNQRNSKISKSHKKANAVVYQSNFSKGMCEKYLAPRNTEIFDVIYNGVNKWDNFTEHTGINIISCSKWRRHKRLPEIVDIFNCLKKDYRHIKLHIVGPMRKGSRKIFNSDIIYYDMLDEKQMREIYRTGDIYIHLSKRDSCPSSVVESISAGIPILTTNVCGGATEMCELTKGCEIINEEEISYDPVYIYKENYNVLDYNVKNDILKSIRKIISNKTRVSLPKELTIENTARKYIDIMKRTLKG